MNDPIRHTSVILPTHNRAHVLGRAVASVLAQTHTDLELIVVDDASTDNTTGVLNAYNDPRVKVIRLSERSGAAAARNRGLEVARGPFVAFQDSDDVWRPHKLEHQHTALADSPQGTGLCVCSMEVVRAGRRHFVCYRHEVLDSGAALRLLTSGTGMGTPCWLARLDVIQAAGGFNESLPRMQDYECALRTATRAPVRLMSEVLVTAEVGDDSISADADAYAHAIASITNAHRGLFARNRAGHAYMVFRAGKYYALAGRRGPALRWFMRALAIRPWDTRALAGAVLAATGLFAPLHRERRPEQFR